MIFKFNATKAVQAGAFLLKQNGGEMSAYLFIKMLYLADRESLRLWGDSITGDSAQSMEHGPVLSGIYDLVRGKYYRGREIWSKSISVRDDETNALSLIEDPGREELSGREVDILKDIWSRFNKYTWFQIKKYSHALPEYDSSVIATKTSKPISPTNTLKHLGWSAERIGYAGDSKQEEDQLHALFGAH